MAKWEHGYKFFSHKIGLKFSKKIGIFPEMAVSVKKGLHFLRGALDAAFPWGEFYSLRCMSSASPNPSLIKWREAYWCHFSVLVFLLPPSSGNFSINALNVTPNFTMCLSQWVKKKSMTRSSPLTLLSYSGTACSR